MMKLYFASAIALCLWLFSLPGHSNVVWDGADYEGPRPVTDERGESTTGIIWCSPRVCSHEAKPTVMDIPNEGYPWQDWFPRRKQ